MNEQITIIGNVGTEPVVDKGADGRTFTRFRVGCTRRFRDPQTDAWRDTESSWYDVTANGMLASNIIKSVSKGTRVIVTGTLAVRKWARDERSGLNVTVRAETVGIDLQWAKVQQIVKTTTAQRSDGEESRPEGDNWMVPFGSSGDAEVSSGQAAEYEAENDVDDDADLDVDTATGEVRTEEPVPSPF